MIRGDDRIGRIGHRCRAARAALEAELSFYAQVFGFEPADRIEPVPITR